MGGGLVGRVGRRVRDVVVGRVDPASSSGSASVGVGAPSCGAGAPLLSPFFVRREVDLRRGMASGWPGAELVLWVLMVLRCETVPRADPPRRRVAAWRAAAFSPRSARFASWSDACSRQLTSSVFFEPQPASAAWANETGAMAAGGSDPCRAAMPPPAQDVSAGRAAPKARCDRARVALGPRRRGERRERVVVERGVAGSNALASSHFLGDEEGLGGREARLLWPSARRSEAPRARRRASAEA